MGCMIKAEKDEPGKEKETFAITADIHTEIFVLITDTQNLAA